MRLYQGTWKTTDALKRSIYFLFLMFSMEWYHDSGQEVIVSNMYL